MAIQTAAGRAAAAAGYAAQALFGAVYTTAPGATAGTEPTGGAPAYARKALSWTGTNPITATAVYDIPPGVTVVGAGVHTALTGGTYLDGVTVTSQAFATAGTYTVTHTYTQS